MDNYYFDENGIYTGAVPANPGTMPPDNAIRIDPGEREGMWPVLNRTRDGWDWMEDYRGRKGWLDGRSAEIAELGPLPEGWSDTPPEIPDTRAVSEKRRDAFMAAADPHRDLALAYQLEAEAWRSGGDNANARKAMTKYRQELALYLEAKETVRAAFPDAEGTDSTSVTDLPPENTYFVAASGVCHAPECGFAKGKGQWLTREEIAIRGVAARPCRRCTPPVGA